MKIVHISDTHGKHRDERLQKWLSLIEADVIVHSGDFSRGDWESVFDFYRWYSDLPFKHKLLVPGNHETCLEDFYMTPNYRKPYEPPAEIKLLWCGSEVIDGVRFWGSPYTPAFNNWAFQLYENDAVEHWQRIPDDTDVLITHGPPKGFLDKTGEMHNNDPLGCHHLRARISDLNLKAHLFGHIHGGYGKAFLGKMILLNSCCLNEQYDLVNPPQVFEIKESSE